MTQLYEPHAEGCTCRDCYGDALSDLVKQVSDLFNKPLTNITDREYDRTENDG